MRNKNLFGAVCSEVRYIIGIELVTLVFFKLYIYVHELACTFALFHPNNHTIAPHTQPLARNPRAGAVAHNHT